MKRFALGISRLALALPVLLPAACAVDLRKSECEMAPAVEYENCLNAARDPKWQEEQERRKRLENAGSEEEKRQAECEALQEPELTQCLIGAREPEEQ